MGIIVHDHKIKDPYSSEEYTDIYYHVGSHNYLYVKKIGDDNYEVSVTFQIHRDQSAVTNNRTSLGRERVRFNITQSQLGTSLYTLGYNRLKELYPNYDDV